MNLYSQALPMPTRREQIGRRLGPKVLVVGLKFIAGAGLVYAFLTLGLSL